MVDLKHFYVISTPSGKNRLYISKMIKRNYQDDIETSFYLSDAKLFDTMDEVNSFIYRLSNRFNTHKWVPSFKIHRISYAITEVVDAKDLLMTKEHEDTRYCIAKHMKDVTIPEDSSYRHSWVTSQYVDLKKKLEVGNPPGRVELQDDRTI